MTWYALVQAWFETSQYNMSLLYNFNFQQAYKGEKNS